MSTSPITAPLRQMLRMLAGIVIQAKLQDGRRVLDASDMKGVGSEVHEAVIYGRKAIGIELKPSYYRQAIKNLDAAAAREWRPDTDQKEIEYEELSAEELTA